MTKIYLGISLSRLVKIRKVKDFYDSTDKVFIFSNLTIVRNRFQRTAEFKDILPRLTLDREEWQKDSKTVNRQRERVYLAGLCIVQQGIFICQNAKNIPLGVIQVNAEQSLFFCLSF